MCLGFGLECSVHKMYECILGSVCGCGLGSVWSPHCRVLVPFTVCLGFGLGLAAPLCSCKAFVPLSSIKMALVMKIVWIVMMTAVYIMMASMVRMMIIIMTVSIVTKDTNKAPYLTRTSREVKSSCRSKKKALARSAAADLCFMRRPEFSTRAKFKWVLNE